MSNWAVVDMEDNVHSWHTSKAEAERTTDNLNGPLKPGVDAKYDYISDEGLAYRWAGLRKNSR